MLQSVDESLAIIHQITKPLGLLAMSPILAHGLVLGSPVLCIRTAHPSIAPCWMDMRCGREDARAGVQLEIIGRQDAGGPLWKGELSQGKCIAMKTGGVLPKGANGILMVEHSEKVEGGSAGQGFVKVLKAVEGEMGVQRRAAHARAGDVAVGGHSAWGGGDCGSGGSGGVGGECVAAAAGGGAVDGG